MGPMFARILQDGDLIWALALQAGLCLAMFAGLRKLGRRWSTRALDLLAVLTLGLLFAFLLTAWDQVWLSRILPLANLVILGNAFPVLTAALAANISLRASHGPLRRHAVLALLVLTGVVSCCWPILGRSPECGDRWTSDGTCLQTTRFTCSAACAATLLRSHGIPATEQEMAELCLTRNGTTWLGLYRGLKKKTAGSRWDVEVVECSAEQLRHLGPQPMILRVGINREGLLESSLVADMGWAPGLRHSVVLRGFVGKGFARISDPAPTVESEVWSDDELRELWQGQAVRLVRRSAP